MLERGQPLHAFDYTTIAGRGLVRNRARDGERIVTLDGVERELTPETLIIADRDGPIAIAGVMGGLNSEVTEGTGTVLLESAHFHPSSVRRTSKRLGLVTESSYRFERGVDPGENVRRSIDRAAYLLRTVAGGKRATKTLDRTYLPKRRPSITLRPRKAKTLLGRDLPADRMVEILQRLGIRTSEGAGALVAEPPSYRMDLKEEVDLIEEIARIDGYGGIPEDLPCVKVAPTMVRRDLILQRRIRDTLRTLGFYEVLNYSFLSPDLLGLFGFEGETLSILNPLREDQSVMRPSLIPGLLENVRYNQSHKNMDLRLFELGVVFLKGGREERRKVAGLCTGLRWEGWWTTGKEGIDIFDLKGVVEGLLESTGMGGIDFKVLERAAFFHPMRSYTIIVDGRDIGVMGEIHPDITYRLEIRGPVFVFEIDVEGLLGIEPRQKVFRPIPRYPSVVRDISLLVDDAIPAGSIEEAIVGMDPNIKEVFIFDLYRGKGIPEGKKSLGIRVTYLSEERTLTDDEVNAIHARVVERLKEVFKISIR